ncbi:MAG: hypothetical protein AAB465_00935, partial [Patescibacteria group bacterium]
MCKKCKKHSKKAFVQIPIIMLIASVAALGALLAAPAIVKVGNHVRLAQVESPQVNTPTNMQSNQQIQPMQPEKSIIMNQDQPVQIKQPMMQPGTEVQTKKPEMNSQEVRQDFNQEKRVDSQEIQSVTQQLKDMQKEIKNLLTQLKSLPKLIDEAAQLNEALNQILTFEKNLKNPPTDTTQREVIQEFYDARVWDT